jgi:hypothetical protein
MPGIILKKPYRNRSHKDRANPDIVKAKKQTIVVDALDKSARREVQTEAGTVLFEDGMAVLPADGRGDEVMAELKAKSRDPNAVGGLKNRESMMTHRGHEASQSFFGNHPGVPWAMYDDLGRRIRRRK